MVRTSQDMLKRNRFARYGWKWRRICTGATTSPASYRDEAAKAIIHPHQATRQRFDQCPFLRPNTSSTIFQLCHRFIIMVTTRVKLIYDHSKSGRRPPKNVTDLKIVPSTIKLIGDRTFRAYTNLIHVELPESLDRIGKGAFYGCTSLSSVLLPSTVKQIRDGAFKDCIQLNNIELPERLERIGNKAFYGCTSLSSVLIPFTVELIGDAAFRDCTQLKYVKLQEGLERIPDSAFFKCTSLSRVIIPSTIKSIGNAAFEWCDLLNNIELPVGLEEIGMHAFLGCTSLSRIIIPSTIKSLYGTFQGCTRMNNIVLREGLERIEQQAFDECTSLTSIIIPSTVKKIGCWTFRGCTQLNNIELAEGLEEIGMFAFKDCTALEIVRIPSTVKCLHKRSFDNCTSMSAIHFCEEIEEFVALSSLQGWWNHGCSKLSLETYNHLVRYDIPRRTSEIGMTRWRTKIHAIIHRIPLIASSQGFDLFDSKLWYYRHHSFRLWMVASKHWPPIDACPMEMEHVKNYCWWVYLWQRESRWDEGEKSLWFWEHGHHYCPECSGIPLYSRKTIGDSFNTRQ